MSVTAIPSGRANAQGSLRGCGSAVKACLVKLWTQITGEDGLNPGYETDAEAKQPPDFLKGFKRRI